MLAGMMTRHTREKWAERVREWRASGLTAEAFAEGKDYEASSLRWADSQLKGKRAGRSPRRRGPAETASAGVASPIVRFLPVRVGKSPRVAPDVVVEVGGARIRVGRGADLALVGDVVRALQGGGR
jgi:transposase